MEKRGKLALPMDVRSWDEKGGHGSHAGRYAAHQGGPIDSLFAATPRKGDRGIAGYNRNQ